MNQLTFDFEWKDPGGARGPELSATWARLEIRVGDVPVTRVDDLRARSVRNAIYGPLYPVAEWIVSNWWSLLYEVPSATLVSRAPYSSPQTEWVRPKIGGSIAAVGSALAARFLLVRWMTGREASLQVPLESHRIDMPGNPNPA